MFVHIVETGWMRHDVFFFIEPIHVTPGFCGKGFAMTGTVTVTLTSCPLLDPYTVFIVSELSNFVSPSNHIT